MKDMRGVKPMKNLMTLTPFTFFTFRLLRGALESCSDADSC
jgi:hypothetical protein